MQKHQDSTEKLPVELADHNAILQVRILWCHLTKDDDKWGGSQNQHVCVKG